MSAVDRIAHDLSEHARRISALERSRALGKSALVNAVIPVIQADEDGETTQIGELGKPLFDSIAGITDEMSEHDQRLAQAREKVAEVEQGLTDAQQHVQDALTEAAAAKESAQQAIDDALDATTTAEAAKSAIDQAAQDAKNATEAARKAQGEAAAAKQAADTAASDLLTLAGKTGRLVTSTSAPTGDDRNANNLWLNPTTGQLSQWNGSKWVVITDSRLGEAVDAASSAATKADQAKVSADAATEQASTAATKADQARSQADAAKSAAEAAQAAATAAEGTATAARSEASTAAAAAAAAQATADTAAEDADAAQSIADAAATTAAEAKQRADQAEAKALGAQADADALDGRMSTLDGKITISTRNPTASDATDKPDQAIWEVRSGSTVLRRFILAGGTWTQVKIGTDFIGEKAIGAAQISDASIGTAQIADAAITNAKIGSVSVAKLVADIAKMDKAAIEQLIGDAAFFKVLQANKIVVAGDDTNKVGGTLIENGAITTEKLLATADMWTKLLTVAGDATIGGNLIVGDSIDVTKLRTDEAYAREMAAVMARFKQAFIGKLSAQMIQADTFSGYEVRGAKIVSPGKAGDITITDNTFTVNRDTGPDGAQATLEIGGQQGDAITLTPPGDASPTILMDGATGDASFAGRLDTGDLTVGGVSLDEIIAALPKGVLSWWSSGAPIPSVGSTPLGITRLVFDAEPYRRYRVHLAMNLTGTAGDVASITLRYGYGSVNATSSAALDVKRYTIPRDNLDDALVYVHEFMLPEGGEVHLMPTIANITSSSRSIRNIASGTRRNIASVEDIGYPSHFAVMDQGGGTPFQGAPVPPKDTSTRLYRYRYSPVATRSWRGGSVVNDVLHHGVWDGVRRYSQILFPAKVRSDLAGSSIKSVRLRLRNLHAGPSVMTAFISANASTALTSAPVSSPVGTTSSWRRGQIRSVNVPDWTVNSQSIWLGIGAGSGISHYGKFSKNLADISLEIVCEK